MADVNWAALRKDFPKEQITQVDKGFGPIDTVNHAVVTSRLIADGGDWTYTIDESFTHGKSFWVRITLTVGGVSRPEYGEGQDPKKALSDALKRAAMRFGVALDLWAKAPLDDYEDSGGPDDAVNLTIVASASPGGEAPSVGTGVKPALGTPPVPEPSEPEDPTAPTVFGEGTDRDEGSSGSGHLTKEEQKAFAKALGGQTVALGEARKKFGERIRSLSDLTRDMALELIGERVG